MRPLQQTLASHFPQWFRGARAPVSRVLVSGLSRFGGLDTLESFIESHTHLRGLAFVEAALRWLDCRYLLDDVERERIPQQGRVVIVANHPLGGLDALLLLACVGSIRPDVRIVANDFLLGLESLSDLLLPVPVFGGRAERARLRAIHRALESECAVIIFPAAEVSRLTWRGVRDAPWRTGFLRIARQTGAPLLPVRVAGHNSPLFYGASMMFKPLGTALLPREVLSRRGARVMLRVGAPMALAEIEASGDASAMAVRRAVYRLGRRREAWPARLAPIVHRPCLRRLRSDLDGLALLGETSDGKRIFCGRLATDSALLREIARLRETTFRQVGEGTGSRMDTDAYDSWYDHIVLWDAHALEIAGAYRAVACREAIAARGPRALYCASLFEFGPALAPMVETGVELGRSFVTPRYWGTRSLDYLWYGIGAWLRAHPGIRFLFGPVSLSADLPAAARDWIVSYYSRYYADARAATRPLAPFHYSGSPPDFGALDAVAALQLLRTQLDAFGARLPVLYKQYVDLCEPGGVSFLGFNVDPEFGNCVDGLIRVDLAQVRPHRRARYLMPPQGV